MLHRYTSAIVAMALLVSTSAFAGEWRTVTDKLTGEETGRQFTSTREEAAGGASVTFYQFNTYKGLPEPVLVGYVTTRSVNDCNKHELRYMGARGVQARRGFTDSTFKTCTFAIPLSDVEGLSTLRFEVPMYDAPSLVVALDITGLPREKYPQLCQKVNRAACDVWAAENLPQAASAPAQ